MLARAIPRDPRFFIDGFLAFARPSFAISPAYGRLEALLRLYLTEATRGRAVLIAGHRGAGKTALARGVAEALHREALTAAPRTLDDEGQRHPFHPQRPLFVQLHGPSLLSGKMPEPEKPAPSAADRLAASLASFIQPEPHAEGPGDIGRAALVQIVIALYRAVATEYAEAYRVHARADPSLGQTDRLEAGAQLRLDIDMGADPARLRRQWHMVHRLANGTLWPATIGDHGPQDQGMREIVALATAAQAFQVCAGKVDQEESNTAKNARQSSIELAGKTDLRALADRLFGLAAGAGVGWALNATPSIAAIAGLATALLGTAALTWSSSRSQGDERRATYRFLPDKSAQTLERDLPVVLRRLRDVGLAPIFVIDELDKLPPNEVEQKLAALIDGLKLLLTDHGFFCFLTDRAYYDTLEAGIRSGAFVKAHTYFTDRLFVAYGPEAMNQFVADVISVPDQPSRPEDVLAAAMLRKTVLLESHLNFARLGPLLAGCWDQAGLARLASPVLTADRRHIAATLFQLALETSWRDETVQAALERDPGLIQIVIDALYLLPEAWLDGAAQVGIWRDDIARSLLARMNRAPDLPADAEATLLGLVQPEDFDMLCGIPATQARLLRDIPAFGRELAADPRLAENDRPLLDLFAAWNEPGFFE